MTVASAQIMGAVQNKKSTGGDKEEEATILRLHN